MPALETLIEAAATLENRFVREWRTGGGRVVGYTCALFPDELLSAAGLLPVRLRGQGTQASAISDSYFGPFVCSLPRSLLQLAGEGRTAFLDGVVIVPGCDSMRRLDECWRRAGDDRSGIVPRFFFHFGMPHKYADYTVKWLMEEMHRLRDALYEAFGRRIDDASLREAIRERNRGRVLARELSAQMARSDPPLAGAELLSVALAGSAMPRNLHNELLAECLRTLPPDPPRTSTPGRLRLMLVGSAGDDPALVRLVEGERAIVVALSQCRVPRPDEGLVPEAGDPYEALARHTLGQNACPRMYGGYAGRRTRLIHEVRSAAIDGVILQNIRFCDLHGAENSLLERDLLAAGVPCLRLEREEGPLVETGRLRIRLDAFLERLARSRASRRP